MVQETAATETTGSLAPSILDRRPSSLSGNNKHSNLTIALGKQHLLPSLDTVIHGYILLRVHPANFQRKIPYIYAKLPSLEIFIFI